MRRAARAQLSPARSPGAQRLSRAPLGEPPRGRSGPGPLWEPRPRAGPGRAGSPGSSLQRRLGGEDCLPPPSDNLGADRRTARPSRPFPRLTASRDPPEVPRTPPRSGLRHPLQKPPAPDRGVHTGWAGRAGSDARRVGFLRPAERRPGERRGAAGSGERALGAHSAAALAETMPGRLGAAGRRS